MIPPSGSGSIPVPTMNGYTHRRHDEPRLGSHYGAFYLVRIILVIHTLRSQNRKNRKKIVAFKSFSLQLFFLDVSTLKIQCFFSPMNNLTLFILEYKLGKILGLKISFHIFDGEQS